VVLYGALLSLAAYSSQTSLATSYTSIAEVEPGVVLYGARFHHGFCCVGVGSSIGLWLLYGARFSTEIHTLEDAIEFHAFAPPLEALPCG
jgi:hypothetical protein